MKKKKWSKSGAITQSFHLPYWPSESTLSRIFLFLEASPTGFFAGVYIIANHKTAVVLDCLRHMQYEKYHNNCEKRGTSACFRGNLKNLTPHISVLKIKKIRDRVDSRVQLVWRLRVMGSCQKKFNQKFNFAGMFLAPVAKQQRYVSKRGVFLGLHNRSQNTMVVERIRDTYQLIVQTQDALSTGFVCI